VSSLCTRHLQKSSESEKLTPANAVDQPSQKQDQEQEVFSTAEGQSTQNTDEVERKCSTAKDQPSQSVDAEDREDFVLMVDEIQETSKSSSEEDDLQLQLEWMSVFLRVGHDAYVNCH